MRSQLMPALVLLTVMIAGCSSGAPIAPPPTTSPADPAPRADRRPVEAPKDLPTVRMLVGKREVPGILGSYCWFPGGTGKCVDTAGVPDLVQGHPYTDLAAYLTDPLDQMTLAFSQPTQDLVITRWFPDPLYDPAPGAPQKKWVSEQITADSKGQVPLPKYSDIFIYEVQAWWEGGGSAVYAFPITMPGGHMDFATLQLGHIANASLGQTLLHPHSAEGSRVLEPFLAALRTATFHRTFEKAKAVPDVTLTVTPVMGDTMRFGYSKGHGVTVWTEKWELWTDSPALMKVMAGLAQSPGTAAAPPAR